MDCQALRAAFAGRTVLLTGHSGFKGSWLTAWLDGLGARVIGLSLPPERPDQSLFVAGGLAARCRSYWVDIRDARAVAEVVRATRPEIVLHLAGQALVRRGFAEPLATFAINAGGTYHLLEAVRAGESVVACLCVTSDKVYAPHPSGRPHVEADPLGGADPYAASKAAAEHAVRSYAGLLAGRCAVASARGGNVVGGGDWAADRLVPDIVRAVRDGQPLRLRYPQAVRPWQHVLDALHGYLVLAARLAEGWPARNLPPDSFVGAYNIGPPAEQTATVQAVAEAMLRGLDRAGHPLQLAAPTCLEATQLRLDPAKARHRLGWRARLDLPEALDWTARWYAGVLANPSAAPALMQDQLGAYVERNDIETTDINPIASVA